MRGSALMSSMRASITRPALVWICISQQQTVGCCFLNYVKQLQGCPSLGVQAWCLQLSICCTSCFVLVFFYLNECAVVAVPDDALHSTLWPLLKPRAKLLEVDWRRVSNPNAPVGHEAVNRLPLTSQTCWDKSNDSNVGSCCKHI